MKRSIRLLILPAVLLGALPASAEERPNFDAYFDKATPTALPAASRLSQASPDGVSCDPPFYYEGRKKIFKTGCI